MAPLLIRGRPFYPHNSILESRFISGWMKGLTLSTLSERKRGPLPRGVEPYLNRSVEGERAVKAVKASYQIKKLIDVEALGLSRLAVIVLDMHTDVKGYSLFTLPQVRDEFWDFYKCYFHPRLLQDTKVCVNHLLKLESDGRVLIVELIC
ncbi:uncharacterized protein LOC131322636 [Rhododendron vialii]|uniref:uncharacterized protein LOC131322636 n=1 Tax=Rhododendron vialii TaxID=182163 RepID=UPI0026605175|nr:uncharacterized protein LOC131322636 [Rhododendron vialii]